jgi:hypothetical protein
LKPESFSLFLDDPLLDFPEPFPLLLDDPLLDLLENPLLLLLELFPDVPLPPDGLLPFPLLKSLSFSLLLIPLLLLPK